LNVNLSVAFAAILALSVPTFALDCPKDQPKTEAALIALERNWAEALSRHDAATVGCMAADEFEEADVDGSLHTRVQMLERISHRKPGSNHLTDLRAHADGNFGFVRGLNEVLDPAGKIVARVRFTDVFTYRDGRWQAILAHESLLGEASR
jgi:ketosteroid isomerase-like protein